MISINEVLLLKYSEDKMLKYFLPFLSVVLYFFAPIEYSILFNWVILFLFILNFILFVRKRNCRLLSYTTIFFVSFFFVNFAYPVFIYPYDPTFIYQFQYSFSPDYINRGSALCYCAFSMYLAGFSSKVKNVRSWAYSLKYGTYQIFTVILYIILLYNLYVILPQIGVSYGNATIPFQTGSLFTMLQCTLVTVVCHLHRNEMHNDFKRFLKILKFQLIAAVVFCIASLMLGSREYVLVLLVLYVFAYTKYVKELSVVKLCIGGLIGLVGLYYVSQTRNGSWGGEPIIA